MKKNLIKCLLVIWMIICSQTGFAQALSNAPTGSRTMAMGGISVALNDFWSLQNNQAGLAGYTSAAAGIDWQNRFLVKELSCNSAGVVVPTNSGVFAAGMQYFGYSLYNESKLGLAYARKLGEQFSAGLQLDYFNRHIAEGYGNASAFTFELGIQADLTENFRVGVHVFNPVRAKYDDSDGDKIPAVFTVGILYEISDGLIVSVESEKDSEFKPLFRGGLEYKIIEPVSFRFGFSSAPARTGSDGFSIANRFAFGFGYEWKQLSVDVAASVHQTLGWSPGISIHYNFGKANG